MQQHRSLQHTLTAQAVTDGAGVQINRVSNHQLMNPFLVLDEIHSDAAADYLAGFPEHPHRGFETITYMKAGRMRHQDHMGNVGVVEPGGVQWMSAGRGVIHSEMPEQDSGLMHGFQIWLNLPAAEKLKPADYQDLPAHELAVDVDDKLRVIAGSVRLEQRTMSGPLPVRSTQPVLFDMSLAADEAMTLQFAPQQPAWVYVYQGQLSNLGYRQMGVFSPGEQLKLTAADRGAGVLVMSGGPLDEPIVQYGPFVMNSTHEIEQALRDFAAGELV